MAWQEATGNTTTLTGSSTEDALGSAQTAAGLYIIAVDLNAIAGGDQGEIRIYTKVRTGATARVIHRFPFANVQADANWQSPPIAVGTGDIQLKIVQSAGTGRSVVWSYMFDPGGMEPATVGRKPVVDANGLIDANMVKAGPTGSGSAITARDIGASVLLSAGSGTGQLDFTSGVVKANLAQILGTALTETSGQIAAAFKKVFDVASATFTALSVNQTGDSFARLGAPAGASVSADVAATKALLPTALVGGRIDASVGAMANNVVTAAAIATDAIDADSLKTDAVTEISVGVVDQSLSGHTTGGTVGGALNAASSAGDPWATALPGSYTSGQAGKLIGDNINSPLSAIKTVVDAIKAITDVLISPATIATSVWAAGTRVLTAGTNIALAKGTGVTGFNDPTANDNADALLDRAAGVESGWTVRQALRVALAALSGLLSGAGTGTEVIANPAGTKSRITATVDDDGNRTAIVNDVS